MSAWACAPVTRTGVVTRGEQVRTASPGPGDPARAPGTGSPGCASPLCGVWPGLVRPGPARSLVAAGSGGAPRLARGSLCGRCLQAAFCCFLPALPQVIFRVRHPRRAAVAFGGCASVTGEGRGVPFTEGKAKQSAWLRRRGWK